MCVHYFISCSGQISHIHRKAGREESRGASHHVSGDRAVQIGLCAAAGYAAASVTSPTRVPGGLSARPWRSHATAAPGSPVVAESFRRPYPSAAYSSRRRPEGGRLGNALDHGAGAVRCDHNGNIWTHPDADGVPARTGRYDHPGVRLLESQPDFYDTMLHAVARHEPSGFERLEMSGMEVMDFAVWDGIRKSGMDKDA